MRAIKWPIPMCNFKKKTFRLTTWVRCLPQDSPWAHTKISESLILGSKAYLPLMFQGTGFWNPAQKHWKEKKPKFVLKIFDQELVFFVNINTCSSSGKLGSKSLFQGSRLSKGYDGKSSVEKLTLHYFVFLIYRKNLNDYFLLLLKNSYIFLENWQLWSLNCATDSTHSQIKKKKVVPNLKLQ